MKLDAFLEKTKYPLIVVGTLPKKAHEAVAQFICHLKMPAYLEGVSGLREDPRLSHCRITYIHELWKNAAEAGYPIDGVIRIGGVPTFRPWRDLEDRQDKVAVCSLSHLPFTGLSGGEVTYGNLETLLPSLTFNKQHSPYSYDEWLSCDQICEKLLNDLFEEEPLAESSLMHSLSKQIPQKSLVYLGNSLPIREWDLAANREQRNWKVFANRGVNGIDGQISTFLGLCAPGQNNWGIIGDLTALYDMAGPWILKQLHEISVNLVIINNGGGQIFSRMFPKYKEFLHEHTLNFEHLAKFWDMDYERWANVPDEYSCSKSNRLIEIVPDPDATSRFWKKYAHLFQTARTSVGV